MAPGIKELQAVFEQARENRGKEVELIWQVPGTYKTYSILIKFDRVTPSPLWQVWEDNGRESKMVWRFETADINMIYDVVAMLDVSNQKTTGTAPIIPPAFNPTASGTFSTTQQRGLVGSGGASPTRTQSGLPAMTPYPAKQGQDTAGWRGVDEKGWKTVENQGGPAAPTGQQPTSSFNQLNSSGAFSTGQMPGQQQPGYSQPGYPAQPGYPPQQQGLPPQQPGLPQQQPGYPPQQQQQFQQQQGFPQQPAYPPQQQQFPQQQFQQPPQSFSQPQPPVLPQGQPGYGTATGGMPLSPSATGSQPLQKPQTASGMPEGSLPADFFSEQPATIAVPTPKSSGIEGSIEQTPLNNVLTNIGMQQLTGKLEVMGDSAVGHVYFENGIPKDAQTSTSRGDDAIKELVTWRRGTYLFKQGLRTEMRSVEKSLQTSLLEGVALLEQMKHLEKAGLVYESILTQKQKNLGEPELKLMLSKGHPLDFNLQKDVYESLKHKMTFTDLLRDRPMEQTQWAPLLFNLLYCGLMEIKPPTTTRGGALDFLGEGKQIIQNLAYNFIRPDTGIMSFEALLYFMEYEYYRFEAYSYPMSLVAIELSVRRPGSNIGEVDPLPIAALSTASTRIGLVKRPLDLLTHFQVNEYAILMPNTKASQAAFVANRILDALTVTPLAPGIDRANLSIAMGVANLPADGEDLETLIQSAESARLEAREGNFPIVLARSSKRD